MARSRWNDGQSLAELVLAIAVFVIGVSTLVVLYADSSTTFRHSLERSKANELALEGLEATRSIRNRSFANLTAGPKGLIITSNRWDFFGSSDIKDGFTRVIDIGVVDADSRFVTSTVYWQATPNRTATATFSVLFTDWGRFPGDPTPVGAFDLPGTGDGLSVASTGTTVYIGRRDNTDKEFYIVDAFDPTLPVIKGSLEIGADVLGIALVGNFAYLLTPDNGGEIRIVNVASPTNPFLVATINLTGNGDALGGFVSDARLYLARSRAGTNPTYEIYDITSSTNPTLLGGLNVGDTVRGVTVVKIATTPWAFLATDDTEDELKVVNSTSPSLLSVDASLDLAGSGEAFGISASGTEVYIGRDVSSGSEFVVVNGADPTDPLVKTGLEFEDNINAVFYSGGLVHAVSASATQEYVKIQVPSVGAATIPSFQDLDGPANGVSVSGGAAYVVTGLDLGELYVIVL